jgi:hypothetical protein
MNKEIKQLQEEVREEFEEKFCDKYGNILREYVYYTKNGINEDIKSFQDTLIEKTYNKARKDLIEEDIKRLEGKKKIGMSLTDSRILQEGLAEKCIEKVIFACENNKLSAYNQALQEEINYKKNNKKNMNEKKEPKYKVGDETNFIVCGLGAKVKQVVLWDDGIIRYELEKYGGLVEEDEC